MATTILGISPGTRTMGVGVIQNGELVEWQVKIFKGRWSKEKLDIIMKNIQSLCDHFQVTDVALKVVSPLRSSRNLLTLTNRITELAEKHKIRISRFTVQDLRLKIGLHGKRSMDELMEHITQKYPVLKREYLKERNNLNTYYLKMFEAIAAARLVDK